MGPKLSIWPCNFTNWSLPSPTSVPLRKNERSSPMQSLPSFASLGWMSSNMMRRWGEWIIHVFLFCIGAAGGQIEKREVHGGDWQNHGSITSAAWSFKDNSRHWYILIISWSCINIGPKIQQGENELCCLPLPLLVTLVQGCCIWQNFQVNCSKNNFFGFFSECLSRMYCRVEGRKSQSHSAFASGSESWVRLWKSPGQAQTCVFLTKMQRKTQA